MSLVPLTDVKTHLGTTNPSDDPKLQAMLDGAETTISRRIGGYGTLAATSVTQRAPGGGASLVLSYLPVASLTSVTGIYSGALSLSDLDFDATDGLVYYLPAAQTLFLDPYYTVVYNTGYANLAALPADLVLAVKELTRHLWDTQRGSGAAGLPLGGQQPNVGYSLPNRVLELIAPYLRSGFA